MILHPALALLDTLALTGVLVAICLVILAGLFWMLRAGGPGERKRRQIADVEAATDEEPDQAGPG